MTHRVGHRGQETSNERGCKGKRGALALCSSDVGTRSATGVLSPQAHQQPKTRSSLTHHNRLRSSDFVTRYGSTITAYATLNATVDTIQLTSNSLKSTTARSPALVDGTGASPPHRRGLLVLAC